MEDISRFWAKVDKTDTCWNWTAYSDASGYGQFRHGSRLMQAHRYSYLNFVGDLIEGLVVDHLCSNRKCVNPSHLEQVTQKQNVMRARSKVTHCPSGHEYDAIRKNGKYSARYCKTCHATAKAKYKQKNREKTLEQSKEYYQDNKEQIKESKKEYYQNNKEKILKQKKEYYQKNKSVSG